MGRLLAEYALVDASNAVRRNQLPTAITHLQTSLDEFPQPDTFHDCVSRALRYLRIALWHHQRRTIWGAKARPQAAEICRIAPRPTSEWQEKVLAVARAILGGVPARAPLIARTAMRPAPRATRTVPRSAVEPKLTPKSDVPEQTPRRAVTATAGHRVLLTLEGQYLELVRELPEEEQAQVRAIRKAKGYIAAVTLAKEFHSKI